MRMVAIDWSGAKQCRGKLWIAVCEDGTLHSLAAAASRQAAIEIVLGFAGSETVVGLDFSFSLPAWFLRDQQLSHASELWTRCAEHSESWLAACEAPFWGRPGKRRPDLPAHFRRTEQAVRSVGGISPKSSFQVGGAGAVGTGSLRGMPFLATLRENGFAIWPFDQPVLPFVFEMYPRLMTGPVVKSSPSARADYLARGMTDVELPPHLRDLAASCEDAFDAAVSAIQMSRHADALRALPSRRDDAVVRLEGEIWQPPASE